MSVLIADIFRDLRQERGLSRIALAQAASVGQSTIVRIEEGRNRPQYTTTIALVQALDEAMPIDLDSLRMIADKTGIALPVLKSGRGRKLAEVRDDLSRVNASPDARKIADLIDALLARTDVETAQSMLRFLSAWHAFQAGEWPPLPKPPTEPPSQPTAETPAAPATGGGRST